MIAFEIWPSSARTGQRSGACSNLSVTRSPSSRRSSSDSSVSVSASASTLRLQRLLAREGEQLAHQAGGAHRVLPHLVDLGEGGIAGRVAHQQQIAIADDRLQQIVEVVRDAARELADRLHLLRLRELRLERLLLGGVDEIENRLRRAVMGAAGRGSRRAARCGRTISAPAAQWTSTGSWLVSPAAARPMSLSAACRSRGSTRSPNFAPAAKPASAKNSAKAPFDSTISPIGAGDGDADGRIAEEIGEADQRRRRGLFRHERPWRRALQQARREPPRGLAVLQRLHGGGQLLARFRFRNVSSRSLPSVAARARR